MTRPGRLYDIRGVGLLVSSQAPAVLEALERRFESFRASRWRTPELRLEFLVRGEGEETRVGQPRGPSRPVYEAPGGEIQYHPAADALFADLQGVRLRCQAGDGVGLMESDDFSGRRLYLATHALATVCLIELLKRHGRFNLHAACLAREGRGVLLAGPSGSGKSTLAIALVRAGLSFLSDDMVYIEPCSGGVRMLGFPDAVGITEQTALRFPELRHLLAQAKPDGFPKRLVRMQSVFGASELASCIPRRLIFPEVIGEGGSRMVALEPSDAMLRLVPDVLLTQPATAQAHLAALAALLEQVECHVLEVSDLARSVELIVDRL